MTNILESVKNIYSEFPSAVVISSCGFLLVGLVVGGVVAEQTLGAVAGQFGIPIGGVIGLLVGAVVIPASVGAICHFLQKAQKVEITTDEPTTINERTPASQAATSYATTTTSSYGSVLGTTSNQETQQLRIQSNVTQKTENSAAGSLPCPSLTSIE